MHNLPNKGRDGFTLIELMMAIVIFTITLGSIYSVFASVQKSSTSNSVNARIMQDIRTSIGFMESDIRMAGLERFGSAGAGIETATATTLRFTADRNMDGIINIADLSDGLQESDLERITYSYDAPGRRLRQCLSEGTTDAWETVAEGVSGFAFRFFDESNSLMAFPIADSSLIREVEITLTLKLPAGIAGEVSRTFTKRVLCRNLGI